MKNRQLNTKKNKLPNYLLDNFFNDLLTNFRHYYYTKFILNRILKLEENSKKNSYILKKKNR